jgi:hypothetical protein
MSGVYDRPDVSMSGLTEGEAKEFHKLCGRDNRAFPRVDMAAMAAGRSRV